ncbi:MAG: flagellar basal body rod protein FlgC [Firmicutes bacterium]|nr:flagellar basal body rod protein FlgC [Bacillota bacterium]
MFDGMKIASTGLVADSTWLSVIANDLANADTTVTPQGGPYRSEYVTFQAVPPTSSGSSNGVGQGVMVAGIYQDQGPLTVVYDPTSPQANAQGDVLYPNVSLPTQMVDLIQASAAYQANVSAFNSAKAMDVEALTIGTTA